MTWGLLLTQIQWRPSFHAWILTNFPAPYFELLFYSVLLHFCVQNAGWISISMCLGCWLARRKVLSTLLNKYFWGLILTKVFYQIFIMQFVKLEQDMEQHREKPALRCGGTAHCQSCSAAWKLFIKICYHTDDIQLSMFYIVIFVIVWKTSAVYADWVYRAYSLSTPSLAVKPVSSLMKQTHDLVLAPSMSLTFAMDDEYQCLNAFHLRYGCSVQWHWKCRNKPDTVTGSHCN